eukprot:TRINITY_DN2099_c0_g3_i1.p1 TRINITY_DN2099_c0_g3~~TRINITY_DN2099_c0_g3_i1.p1  ORF type:complete len:363 (+),score=182.58 TRINITY_DN2099_c0_g3_i1:64-1089(+)
MSQLQVYSDVPAGVSAKLIGTHDGAFHCDEALAVAMLKMTGEFEDAVVVRSRKPDILAQCNVVVDVGAKYEPEKLLFDHHQPEFQGTMDTGLHTYNTRLSSAGLVYKHYGREVIAALVPGLDDAASMRLYDKVYKAFMEHIDGIDNGVAQFKAPSGEKLIQNYQVSTSLSSRVGALHPRWNQPSNDESFNDGFKKAVAMTREAFVDKVDFYGNAWLPARAIVNEMLEGRFEVHPSGKIVKLAQHCPWGEHLFEAERDMGIEGEVLYCLFPDAKRGYRVRAVGVEGTDFGQRKSLPWKGLRDDALSQESGIPGGVFVHASGFIGGNETYEGARAMAVKALEM